MKMFKINRYKSEAPVMAVFAIFGLIISLVFYPKIYLYSFLIFPLLFVAYLLMSKYRLAVFARESFLIVDEEGIRFCFHLFQQAKSLRWDQVDKVNFQMYEINLKLKNTAEIISFQTAYLDDQTEVEDLRNYIRSKCTMM